MANTSKKAFMFSPPAGRDQKKFAVLADSEAEAWEKVTAQENAALPAHIKPTTVKFMKYEFDVEEVELEMGA